MGLHLHIATLKHSITIMQDIDYGHQVTHCDPNLIYWKMTTLEWTHDWNEAIT